MNNKVVSVIAIVAVAVALWLLPQVNALQKQVAALGDEQATLKHQAQAAADYVDIANLQTSYGFYVDKSRWDDASALFADDATLEIAGRGVFNGKARISEYLHGLGEMEYGRLYNHMQLQPVIHVAADGLNAKARWRSLMEVGHLGKEARWGDAIYENEYVKQGGVWKINKLHSYITFYVDFDQGWNKGGVALPQPFADRKPDGEASVKYGAFPEVFLPPYHYKNPVTGQ
ncbi:MAG TPA: nuclear transport factor 2 family protein [Candidatus Acidoferrum sp.]|nr:nuclear transport factor 2 family protein [Candidatus Acidoferrum sp.]